MKATTSHVDKNPEGSSVDDKIFWKTLKFEEKDNPHPVLETSSFEMLFPKYLESSFKENWSQIENLLKSHGVGCKIDYIEGSVEVHTTSKMWDPYIIIKSRDMMKLLSRSVPFSRAKAILEDDVFCEVIKLQRSKLGREKFVKRRNRLIGPDRNTLKSLEILLGAYIHVQGNTASVIGSVKSIRAARTVIEDTMSNIHPVYNIKALMVKHDLLQNEGMKSEDWSKYIPKYTRTRIKNKKIHFKKRDTTAFPPPPTLSKVDRELETGEYFLKKHEKKNKEIDERNKKQVMKSSMKKYEKNSFEALPAERSFSTEDRSETLISVEKIKKNLQAYKNRR